MDFIPEFCPGIALGNISGNKKTQARRRTNTKPSKKTGQGVVQIRSPQKKPGKASYRYEALKKFRARRRTDTKPSKKPGQGVVRIRSPQKNRATRRTDTKPSKKTGQRVVQIRNLQKNFRQGLGIRGLPPKFPLPFNGFFAVGNQIGIGFTKMLISKESPVCR